MSLTIRKSARRPYTAEQVRAQIAVAAWCFGSDAERKARRGDRRFYQASHGLRSNAHRTGDPLEMAWAVLFRAAYYGKLPTREASYQLRLAQVAA